MEKSTLNRINFPFTSSVIVCVAFFSFCLVQSYAYPIHDFANSYFSSYLFLRGDFTMEIFQPYLFNKKIYDAGFSGVFANFNPNPPFTAIFFTPFVLLPVGLSKLLFNIITSIFFLGSTFRLCRHLNVKPWIVFLCIPTVFALPVRNEILFGQTYFLIMCLLTEGYIAYDLKKPLVASALWAVAIFIKVFPVLIFLFLAVKKDWKCMAYLLCACLLILGVSIGLQGIAVWKEFFVTILPRNNQGEIGSAYTSNYQSALMLFKYLFIKDELLNPSTLPGGYRVFAFLLLIFKSVVLGFCCSIMKDGKSIVAFGSMLLCAMLISPYGSTYGNILLLILLMAVLKENDLRHFLFTAILIFLISNLPINLFQHLPVLFRFPRLFLMIVLYAVTFYFSGTKVIPATFGLFIILFSGSVFRNTSSTDTSERIVADEQHPLIFDYGLLNGSLYCRYWDEKGENTFVTNVRGKKLTTTDVTILDNQIFYKGRPLTTGRDNKIKARVLDDESILYLSDKGKGIGFYTPRIITLTHE